MHTHTHQVSQFVTMFLTFDINEICMAFELLKRRARGRKKKNIIHVYRRLY